MNQKKKRERITDAERKDAYKEASKFVLDIAKLVFAGVILIILFSFWLMDKIFKGSYMLIYEMNDEGIIFSQTTSTSSYKNGLSMPMFLP